MKAKIKNVVEFSSLDKIDTRRFLFNRTVAFRCASGQRFFELIQRNIFYVDN